MAAGIGCCPNPRSQGADARLLSRPRPSSYLRSAACRARRASPSPPEWQGERINASRPTRACYALRVPAHHAWALQPPRGPACARAQALGEFCRGRGEDRGGRRAGVERTLAMIFEIFGQALSTAAWCARADKQASKQNKIVTGALRHACFVAHSTASAARCGLSPVPSATHIRDSRAGALERRYRAGFCASGNSAASLNGTELSPKTL